MKKVKKKCLPIKIKNKSLWESNSGLPRDRPACYPLHYGGLCPINNTFSYVVSICLITVHDCCTSIEMKTSVNVIFAFHAFYSRFLLYVRYRNSQLWEEDIRLLLSYYSCPYIVKWGFTGVLKMTLDKWIWLCISNAVGPSYKVNGGKLLGKTLQMRGWS